MQGQIDALHSKAHAETRDKAALWAEVEALKTRMGKCEGVMNLPSTRPLGGEATQARATWNSTSGGGEKTHRITLDGKEEETRTPQAELQAEGNGGGAAMEPSRFVDPMEEEGHREQKPARTSGQVTMAQVAELTAKVTRLQTICAERSRFSGRQLQQVDEPCGQDAVQAMLAECCASGTAAGPPGGSEGIGHRILQGVSGCDALPPSCSLECSGHFVSIFENCQGEPVMEGLPTAVMAEWTMYYCRSMSSCTGF